MLLNRKFGEYVLLRRLAVGGQSEVFLAYKVGPGAFIRPVVIKALPAKAREDEKFISLFFKEAFVSTRFAHPNVVTVHDAKIVEGEYCLVMDFIQGQTISDIAQRGFGQGQPLSMTQAVQIIADACDGLHYAHTFRDLDGSSYSIVHCDISPQNIMVTYHGVTKVFDFGIAHIPGYEGSNAPMTVGGKFAYMAPEQLRGEHVDPRSDIFSLGIILYELCTGYRLFRRQTQPEVIKAVCEEPIRKPTELRADLPLFLERCIMKALARDPERRYPNAASMRDDLQQLLAMMSRGGERDELGRYVAELFRAERDTIAQTLSSSSAEELRAIATPMGKQSIHQLDQHSDAHEQTMELDAPQELRAQYAQAQQAHHKPMVPQSEQIDRLESQRDAAQADAEALGERVLHLQQRQRALGVGLGVLLLVLIALAVWLIQAQSVPHA